MLPLTIHFFHSYHDQNFDSSSEGYFNVNTNDTRMAETLEVATCLVIDIFNLHLSRWQSLNLIARADIFSSSVELKQLVTLDLTATIVEESQSTVLKFMMDSQLNSTHLKLTGFPLTLINIHWDNITHATFFSIAMDECFNFLQ